MSGRHLQFKELGLVAGQDLVARAHAGTACGDGVVLSGQTHRGSGGIAGAHINTSQPKPYQFYTTVLPMQFIMIIPHTRR